ncbi:ABC transporter substrate-binding protein [Cohnella faecalis]|uniref:Extracellular solute-binding protein n=1 Tax=Cohnella faecalis TaxID=2315694 RepID=A0A398CST6_9BACL|nr:extracellular solute-binding protein [Cohnella faecalis]RIE04319.1 extracellular solute-binding protein [Cohnella faecalis]
MNHIKGKKIRRWAVAGTALTMLVPLLAACSTDKTDDPKNRHTLRIGTMYGSKQDESYFRQQFTDIFEYTHDGIDIEVVPAIDYNEMQFDNMNGKEQTQQPDPLEKVKAIMTGSNPVDVMIFDFSLLGQLVGENLLKQLDTQMKEDEINASDFAATVIDGIKEEGNGNIYALTPTFMPSALFYNKKLFAKANVTPPHDGMNWDEVFNLAKQMSTGDGKDRVFGFSFSSYGGGENYWDIQNFLAPLKLRMYDENAEKMMVNSPKWTNMWKTVYGLYKDHIIPHQDDFVYDQPTDGKYNPFQGQMFLNGRVAMTIGDYSYISQIQQLNDNADKLKMEKLDWDVVTIPFHTEAANVGANINLSSLAGINTKAANSDDAWEFVKFINSEKWAQLKSRSMYEMPSRKAFIKAREGMTYNVEAFTKLKPFSNSQSQKDLEISRTKPNIRFISELASQAYNAVVSGKLSVEQALKELETRGNDLLQKLKTDPNGPMDDFYNQPPIGGNGDGSSGGGGIVRPMID